MIRTIYKIILIFLILGLTSCGYNPIFSEKNYNFEINQTSFSGEKEINQVIESKFNLIKNNQSIKKKKYDLEINSSKVRKIISKESSEFWKKKFDKEKNVCCNFVEGLEKIVKNVQHWQFPNHTYNK